MRNGRPTHQRGCMLSSLLVLTLWVSSALGFLLPTPATTKKIRTTAAPFFPGIVPTIKATPSIFATPTTIQRNAASPSSSDAFQQKNKDKFRDPIRSSQKFPGAAAAAAAAAALVHKCVAFRNAVSVRLRRWVPVFMLATAFYLRSPAAARADTSLRPGMTRTQAEQVIAGELTRDQVTTQLTTTSSSSENPLANPEYTPAKAIQQAAKESEQQKQYYHDEDDEDEYYTESSLKHNTKQHADLYNQPSTINKKKSSPAELKGITARSKFATMQRHGENEQLTKLKVSLCIFVPTFGGTIVREYLRRRREAVYVKKGLEIQKAQYAEYFNITSTTEDSDVQDALKKQIFNKTKTTKDDNDEDDDDDDNDDDDDDGDDDDDNDDEKPSTSTRKRPGPKRPRGPEGGDGSGKGDTGDGSGRPSDEDMDRLNQMFKRS